MGEKNYTVCDFREEKLSFFPATMKINFFLSDSEDFSLINFSFSKSALEKMIWFNSFLKAQNKSATVIINYDDADEAEGELLMEMFNFPVAEYAKSFGLERIIEKGIQTMDAHVISGFKFQVLDEDLLGQFLERECKAIFQCSKGESPAVNRPDLLEVMTQVVVPSLSS